MAEAIKISISLDTGNINQAAGEIRTKLASALDDTARTAQTAGREAGSALSEGISKGALAAAGAAEWGSVILSANLR